MEPLLSVDLEGGEAKERRKIQFSVPSAVPTQLDPRQVEMIRRRRPTPATLFRLTDHPSPEEELCSIQMATGENGVLKPKIQNIAVYQPPSLKAVQRMAQAHMHKLDGSPEGGDQEDGTLMGLECEGNCLEDCSSDQSAHAMGSEVMVEELANILQAETAAKEEDKEDEEEETERRQADEDRGKD